MNVDFLVSHICLTRRECPLPQHVLGDRKFIIGLGPGMEKSTLVLEPCANLNSMVD